MTTPFNDLRWFLVQYLGDCSTVFVLFHQEFLVTDRSDSERSFRVEFSLPLSSLVVCIQLPPELAWLHGLSSRRVLEVFFATWRSRNKRDFHNRYTGEKARSGLGDFSFAKGECLVSPSRFDAALLSSPSFLEPCAFFRFSLVISREKSHHPRIEISRIFDRVSYTDYSSSGQITISRIDYVGHSPSVKARWHKATTAY